MRHGSDPPTIVMGISGVPEKLIDIPLAKRRVAVFFIRVADGLGGSPIFGLDRRVKAGTQLGLHITLSH